MIILKGIDLPIKKLQSVEVIFRYKEDGLLYGMHELLKPNKAIQIPKGSRVMCMLESEGNDDSR